MDVRRKKGHSKLIDKIFEIERNKQLTRDRLRYQVKHFPTFEQWMNTL